MFVIRSEITNGSFQNFTGYEEIVDIFWGYYKTGLFQGLISIYFSVFFLGHGTEWEYFFGLPKFLKYFFFGYA